MEPVAGGRAGIPTAVIVTPVLMLAAGAAATVGLWVLLNQDPPRVALARPAAVDRAPLRGQVQP